MKYYSLLIHLTKLYPTRKEQKTKVEKLLIANDKPLTDGLVEREVKRQFGHGFTHNVIRIHEVTEEYYLEQVAIHDKH